MDLPVWSHFVTIQKVLLQSTLSSFPSHPITAGRRGLRAGFLLGPTDPSAHMRPKWGPCFFSVHRLFWPKSRSFDYLYSDGEILLQNFPVQATINLYEDSASEEEEDKEEEEEADEKGPEGCVKAPGPAPHRASAPSPSLLLTCPN